VRTTRAERRRGTEGLQWLQRVVERAGRGRRERFALIEADAFSLDRSPARDDFGQASNAHGRRTRGAEISRGFVAGFKTPIVAGGVSARGAALHDSGIPMSSALR
jgi:hypothetical protein